jgi:hypothetical protein
MNFKSLLDRWLAPISYMKKRYPKAAKKRRIIKKWQSRFGTDVDLRSILQDRSKILYYSEINDPTIWSNTTIMDWPKEAE